MTYNKNRIYIYINKYFWANFYCQSDHKNKKLHNSYKQSISIVYFILNFLLFQQKQAIN